MVALSTRWITWLALSVVMPFYRVTFMITIKRWTVSVRPVAVNVQDAQ